MSGQVKKLSKGGLESVLRLQDLRLELEASTGRAMTDTQFARAYMPFSETTWGRLVTDTYTGNTSKMEALCAETVVTIERELDAHASYDVGAFFKTDTVKSVLQAMASARRNKDTQVRLVVYLAETGGGKSAICDYLARTYNALVVEGRESWRQSYTAGCMGVAIAAGASSKDHMRNSREAEEVMISQLRGRARVLAIDEANSFGPQTCNMIKLILNQTPTTVFLAAIPGLFEKMRSSAWFEASQMVRRAVAVIRHPALTPKDVAPFLSPVIGDAKVLQGACRLVADEASRFGLYDFCMRVRQHLRDEFNGDGPVMIDSEAVAKAVAYTRVMMPSN